jgi:alpha-beta hydrolase superfamily lysophospholipase
MLSAQPLYFGHPSRPLFGWHHPPIASGGRAVVLCNPLGLDGTRAHWSYRHLAERLAGAGFDVLRFDWHGTGDSSGDGSEPDQVATWQDDLSQAIEELKRRAGAARVHLVGLRVGATLAAQVAAERDDIDSTVLWMPAATGTAWVSEMAKLHKLYLRMVPQIDAPEPGGEELLGSFASATTIADLGRIDLLGLARRPAPRVLVVEEGTLREGERLRERLTALGSDVSWARLPSQKFLLMVPHRATLPEESIEAIVGWLRALPAAGAPLHPGESRTPTNFAERPVRFGSDHRLFGILTPAAEAPSGDRPAIVLLPAGAVNRCGPHRLYVTMARRWAELGFSVLRIDLSGIGDSPAVAGERENLVYPREGLRDIGAALDFLATEVGAARFIIVGLCSGADLAYQAARREERLVGVVMLNPRTFLDLDLNRVEQPPPRLFRESAPLETEEARRVPAGLRQISERGVDAILVVSERDPGIDYVDRHAPAAMREAGALPRFRRVDIRGTDHTFTTIASQRRVADLVTDEYLSRHG